MNIKKSIFAVLLFFFLSNIILGQKHHLRVKNTDDKFEFYSFSEGDELIVKLDTAHFKIKGVVDSISNHSFIIGDFEIEPAHLSEVKDARIRWASNHNGILGIFSSAILITSGTLLRSSHEPVNTYVGTAALVLGVPLCLKSFFTLFEKRSFKTSKGYHFEIITLKEPKK